MVARLIYGQVLTTQVLDRNGCVAVRGRCHGVQHVDHDRDVRLDEDALVLHALGDIHDVISRHVLYEDGVGSDVSGLLAPEWVVDLDDSIVLGADEDLDARVDTVVQDLVLHEAHHKARTLKAGRTSSRQNTLDLGLGVWSCQDQQMYANE